MRIKGDFCHSKFIIACFLYVFLIFILSSASNAQERDQEIYAEAADFSELVSLLNQMQSTGGTIGLTQDITVPESEMYTYINGRYRKEVVVETNGFTVYVEGSLELWPFLTIRGSGSSDELFHVNPGGELRLISICLDAGENGTAVVQEEGSFFIYGSEESMGIPEFSCSGRIICADTMTASAYWSYSCENLPIVRIPDNEDFSVDMLPEKVLANVNRGHQEYEEVVPVDWDETMFPDEHQRTLVKGTFAEGYTQYKNYQPQCLVIWESETNPYFLNVYLETVAERYDMVFMYGEAPQAGTIYVQSSEDGENWCEISGTEGYMPIETDKNSSFSWILSYSGTESEDERPEYYRLYQILDDGTGCYSEALFLNEGLFFTGADIEGGRGGETSPEEGEDQLSDFVPETENNEQSVTEALVIKPQISLSEPGKAVIVDGGSNVANETSVPDKTEGGTEDSLQIENSANTGQKENEEIRSMPETPEESSLAETSQNQKMNLSGLKKIIGTVLVICILAGCVLFSVLWRKK